MDFHAETKYVFVEAERDLLLAWLRSRLHPDRQYPFGRIVTIYYDTPSLDLYYQKRNGDYLKTKVRLRWYDTADVSRDADRASGPFPSDLPCFLEVKEKVGSVRGKRRLSLRLPAEALRGDAIRSPAVLHAPRRLAELSFRPPGLLVPILEVRYDRFRFVDPESGTRVALDSGIRCTRANGQYIGGAPPVDVRVGVLELKGHAGEAPPALTHLGLRVVKESFSKYARCCDALTQPLSMRA
jgi:hypothetical protein